MKKQLRYLVKNITPNQIALILGCIFIIISVILLIRMQDMKRQLDDLIEKENEITEQINQYEQKESQK